MASILTQSGEEWVVDRLDGAATTASYIAWGTGTASAAKADTTLFGESSEARVLSVNSQPVTDKIRWVGTITANASKVIREVGNFTTTAGGTLVVHGNFGDVSLNSGDTIQFTIDLEAT